ncbi:MULTISPECIES: restriction endonuclease subunit S [Gammaproteobacteria]|uniref:restriction endonuclease subunit S n=1 Tax=Gammaproteobacteria TaxID=1236 RepID=UPI0019124BDA|nr:MULTISPECIES: restriction endonuclease subunit S [Gammaproteobacteria]MBK5303667.1 restriction endonuclease subunit S [Bacillus sp. TH86]MBK5323436.1 restriction endonuclease subunit S [Bacillus sp. TH59]MBK5338386.1 restriction endonuclease subunit S [Bacillus sp. TH57]MBK5312440.1 restriction endonuclease subunit S [Pseudomonas sp. TH71]MBK5317934.1 restriction endonuclease subunit S [Erwinia sp. TH79]
MSFDFSRFGDLFSEPQRNGLTRPRKVRGSGFPMVNMGELFAHRRIKDLGMDLVPVGEKEKHYFLQAGDLLFARQSLVLAGAGQCSIFLGNKTETVFESHLIRCRLDQRKYNPHFYFYFFSSPDGRKAIEAIVEQGAGASGIRGSDLVNIRVPNPPKVYQDDTACFLAKIDDRIVLLRETNVTLEAIAQALFKSWFVDFDPVRAKAEGLEPEGMDAATAALFPDSFEESELGLVPSGWQMATLAECCERVESGGTPKRTVPTYWGGNIPWLTSGEVRNPIVFDTKEKISDLGMRNSSAKLWPKGTTVVAMYGATAGEVCLLAESSTANQACCALIPKSCSRAFIFMCARREREALASKSSGSAQQNLNKGLVSNHPVLLAHTEVLNAFEDLVGAMLDGWIENERQSLTLAQLRDTLLPRLISGQMGLPEAEEMVEVLCA